MKKCKYAKNNLNAIGELFTVLANKRSFDRVLQMSAKELLVFILSSLSSLIALRWHPHRLCNPHLVCLQVVCQPRGRIGTPGCFAAVAAGTAAARSAEPAEVPWGG